MIETELPTEIVRDHLANIEALNRDVVQAFGRYDAARRDAANKKKEYDELSKQLQFLISEGPDPQIPLPFAEGVTGEVGGTTEDPNTQRRATPLRDALGLTANQLERLEGSGILTVGDLEESIADVDGGAWGLPRRSVESIRTKLEKWEHA